MEDRIFPNILSYILNISVHFYPARTIKSNFKEIKVDNFFYSTMLNICVVQQKCSKEG